MPISSDISIAGLSSDQKLAAIITPAVKPSAVSSALRLTSRKKNTAPAPRAVSPQVNVVAASACITGDHPANVSSMRNTASLVLDVAYGEQLTPDGAQIGSWRQSSRRR